MFNETKYIVIKGIEYLEQEYTDRNAVAALDTITSAGITAAITRPWGVTSAFKVPELTDATITEKDGMFTIDATLVVDSIEYVYKLDAEGVTVVALKPDLSVIDVPEPEPEPESIEPESEVPVQANTYVVKPLMVGMSSVNGIRFGMAFINKNNDGTPVEEPRVPIRGIKIGVKSEQPVTPRKLKPMEIAEKSLESDVSYVYVVNEDVTKAIEQEAEDKKDLFGIKSLTGREIMKDVVKEELTEDVPVTTSILDDLTDEQRRVLEIIPSNCFDFNISEYTTKDIDIGELDKNGSMYCILSGWHNAGNYYFIDVIQHMSRYFYSTKDKISIEIPAAICKEWAKLHG